MILHCMTDKQTMLCVYLFVPLTGHITLIMPHYSNSQVTDPALRDETLYHNNPGHPVPGEHHEKYPHVCDNVHNDGHDFL